ncbi:aspartate aminotransferase family protein [Paenibacillus antri]|uniref:Aspartate aminotransferase family protein n=1 Tax=Paenibacillus antri TaxID=2582848 RepID=A0A5R9GKC6_9BACL|nr:aspartate aminotransferase family protein [Paenibacillus antri]TLS54024.1 aspartate aminotransferase family protein [Paenibacillus antri]
MKAYTTSKRLFERSGAALAGGVSSSLRAAMRPVPLFAASGRGAVVTDADGNRYIDYLLAYGPLILGHAHPELTERIHAAMTNGYTFGLQHEGEIELAARLTEALPCAEQVAFSGSGTEAVMLALRIARSHTGRTKIVRFHGHYHGWSDAIFTAFPSADMKGGAASDAGGKTMPGTGGQSELALQDVILLPWNDAVALEETLRARGHEVAAVITEPVMCNSGCIRPRDGYLERMRELTRELGIVLIFDEVITGFRFGLGGAHERFGIAPDLMTMGKALAGGIALSAVAGSRELMRVVSSGKVSHLGTLNGNCVATAAAIATLDILGRNGGEAFVRMEATAARLAQGLRERIAANGFRGVVNQEGPVFHMMFIDRDAVEDFAAFSERDGALYSDFAERMLEEGVLVRTNGLWYVSTEHTEAHAEATLQAADRALARLAAERRTEGGERRG